MPLETVLAIMRKNNSCTYGIRLDGLAVVDCDSWNDSTRNFVEVSVPTACFQVITSRGRHLYFRNGQPMPKVFRRDGIQIDFKHGHNHFVLGPGSVRPDGKSYSALSASMPRMEELGEFQFITNASENPVQSAFENTSGSIVSTQAFTSKLVPVGKRNNAAFRQAIRYAKDDLTREEMLEALSLWVNIHCENPAEFLVSDANNICDSACRMRAEGRLYHSRQSEFRVSRAALNLIMIKGGAASGNILLLYSYLQAQHGHRGNMPFAIVSDAIAKSPKFRCGKSTIDRSKQALKQMALIKLLRKGKHMEPDLYVLTPIGQISDA